MTPTMHPAGENGPESFGSDDEQRSAHAVRPTMHPALPSDQYHRISAASSTGLRLLATRGAAVYRAAADREPRKPTVPMVVGDLVHLIALQPELVAQRVQRAKGMIGMTAAQRRAYEDAKRWQDIADRAELPLPPEQYVEAVERAYRALRAMQEDRDGWEQIPARLNSQLHELSILWEESTPSGPVRCKARLDVLREYVMGARTVFQVIDLKSTDRPHWDREVGRQRYDLQAAHYVAGLRAVIANGQLRADDVRFAFLGLGPAEATWYPVSSPTLERAERDRVELIEELADRTARDDWRGPGLVEV